MPEPTKPRVVNKADYRYCSTCDRMIAKEHLTAPSGFFSDEPQQPKCPKGHPVDPEEKNDAAQT